MGKDPYKDSNYDDAGMPLGTDIVDCDADREQRRFATVKQIIPLPEENAVNLVDNDYEEKELPNKVTKKDIDLAKFNGAIEVPLEKQPEGEEKEKAIAEIDAKNAKQADDDDAFLNENNEVKESAKPDAKTEVKEEVKK